MNLFTSESPVALSWRTQCREPSCQLHQELYPALCLEEQQEWFQACQVQLVCKGEHWRCLHNFATQMSYLIEFIGLKTRKFWKINKN